MKNEKISKDSKVKVAKIAKRVVKPKVGALKVEKKQTVKAKQITALLVKEISVADIMKRLKVSSTYVYNIKHRK